VGTPSANEPPPGIALFDLDGTLLAWDCQLLFRDFVVRREPWRRVFLLLFLALAPLAPLLGTDRMKRVFLAFLWRMPREELDAHCRDFADSVMPLIYPEVRAMLEKHRAAGHLLILASASPEGYVREIGARLGFDISLGTPVEHGPLFPHLTNHKGAAKVRRLEAVLTGRHFSGRNLVHSHGYTDSTADLPMLALCDTATVVNPKPPLETMARANGWTIVRPRRPWHGRLDHAWRSICLLLGTGRDPAGRLPLTDRAATGARNT
jgi:HAD superfamily hydrolase (TIGR01490 family)